MKRIILALIAIAFSAGALFAQNEGDTRLSPENERRCTELTRTMVNELRLNEIGYIQLKALNRERFAKAEAAKAAPQQDAATLANTLAQIDKEFDQKLEKLLDASQLQAYAAYKQKHNANLIAISGGK